MRGAFLLVVLGLGVVAAAQESPFVFGTVKDSRPKPTPTLSPLLRRAVTLGPNRPTNKIRATLLGQAYFEYHLGGCGGLDEAIEQDRKWLFTTKVGAAGRPGPTILVNKRTGTTSAKGLPTVTDPSTYYRKPLEEPYWITHQTP